MVKIGRPHGLRATLALALLVLAGCAGERAGDGSVVTLLNASYDPTRELYREFNEAFARHWKEKTGQAVEVQQSHGGSGSQSRAVIDGLDADVVTLALAYDVDGIAKNAELLPEDWQKRLPHNSAPYVSTIAFLVRKGNPKGIAGWEDLGREGVAVITPNPKTSGVARWNFLAMWGYALRRELGPDFVTRLAAGGPDALAARTKAEEYVTSVYRNVPVLDSGARGATNTFIQRRIGDVLINWENELLLASREIDAAGLEIVIPEVSILAEPVVAIVDKNVDRKGTREVAQAYLEYLYSEEGQDLAARHYFRPNASETARAKYREQFPEIDLFTIDEVLGGWGPTQRDHFADGGSFDRIYQPH